MASLRQKFHLVDNGLMVRVQSIGRWGERWGRGAREEERFFLMSVLIAGSAGVVPSVSHQRTNV